MIHVEVKDRASASLKLSATTLSKNVVEAVKREALHLVAYVKSQKLSDQVLHVRTGRLRRSITAHFDDSGSVFRARVGTNVSYARAHELGFQGTVTVPDHDVKAYSRMQTMAFGKMMKSPRKVTVRAHSVKAHSMNMNIPARPFLRPALEENATRITTNIRDALAKAIKE